MSRSVSESKMTRSRELKRVKSFDNTVVGGGDVFFNSFLNKQTYFSKHCLLHLYHFTKTRTIDFCIAPVPSPETKRVLYYCERDCFLLFQLFRLFEKHLNLN